jgi:hypothetical protein
MPQGLRPPGGAKKIFRESFDRGSMYITGPASELLAEVATEFLQILALGALDLSEDRCQRSPTWDLMTSRPSSLISSRKISSGNDVQVPDKGSMCVVL